MWGVVTITLLNQNVWELMYVNVITGVYTLLIAPDRTAGFPLSSFLKKRHCKLGRNARMLGCQVNLIILLKN